MIDFPALAFVDLETTGATPSIDRITEIGIVEVDAEGVREWSQLVNPQMPIPPFIAQLTGIDDAMVAQAPTFDRVAAEVLARLKGKLFIAHNARFDYGFLKNEFRRLGLPFRADVLCTVRLSRRLNPQHHRHNLDALISRHGLTADTRHRALADAKIIHQLWNRLHEERSADEITAAVRALAARPSLPPHLEASLVDDLPDTPGAYLFHGENDLPLYIGKAKDLRQRVLAHFSADNRSAKEMRLAQQVRRITWHETAGEIGALLREAALVKSLQPLENRRLRQNLEVTTLRLADHGAGLLKPEPTPVDDIDFSKAGPLYGLFATRKEAIGALTQIATDHELCYQVLGLETARPGKPCFNRQIKRCRGACEGKEPLIQHSLRLTAALVRLKLLAWPFTGPALLREGDEAHVIDAWSYRGTAKSDEEIAALLAGPRPPFDRDVYKLLVKHVGTLKPLSQRSTRE